MPGRRHHHLGRAAAGEITRGNPCGDRARPPHLSPPLGFLVMAAGHMVLPVIAVRRLHFRIHLVRRLPRRTVS